jgi:hypothetical protein
MATATSGRRGITPFTTPTPEQEQPMAITTHRARIVGPVSYRAGSGRMHSIPIGPCLVESLGGRSIDIIWGARGQSSVALPVEDIEAAQEHGHLLLLD